MDISSVCILGGSGFVGRAIADELARAAIRMRIVSRSRPRAAPLTVFPMAEVAIADVHDPEALRRCFEGCDAVVNLVGILHESRHQTFARCHEELPRKVVEACRATGVRHLLHMSALATAPDAPSRYLRSKAQGEAAVREAGAVLPFTIFRPSVIFGEGDHFLNLFAGMLRWFPVIPLAGARARFAPVWVEDVARCFAIALGNPRAFGQTYELCGPRAYTLGELVAVVGNITGHRRPVMPLPDAIAGLQAAVLERLPGKLMTRDNLRSMAVDNVCAGGFPELFGFQPSPIEAVAPGYLSGSVSRSRYPRFRAFAGR